MGTGGDKYAHSLPDLVLKRLVSTDDELAVGPLQREWEGEAREKLRLSDDGSVDLRKVCKVEHGLAGKETVRINEREPDEVEPQTSMGTRNPTASSSFHWSL